MERSAAAVRPMSDRRAVVLVVALLTAAVSLLVTIAALLALRDPVVRGGETGAPMDVTRLLVGTTVVGVLLTAACAATVVGLIRAQLRGRG